MGNEYKGNYKEYTNEIVLFKDLETTFDKIDLWATDENATYTKVICRGQKEDLIEIFGNERVLTTQDYYDTWSTSVGILDNSKIKGKKFSYDDVIAMLVKKIDSAIRHEKKKQLKKQKQEQRRRNKK